MKTGLVSCVVLAAAAVLGWAPLAAAKELAVGPGREFGRIEDALAKAAAGDTILVHPLDAGKPYEKAALFVNQPRLTIRGVPGKDGSHVKVSGKGYDYSGRGSVPRAIVQFNRNADGCTIEGFELFGAHNDSHNGAGVRIVFASDVTVRNCEIHHNDMGIMSNGDGTQKTAANQLIERCVIHHNGDLTEPGYNHNLYLGGTSVTLRFCEVHSSTTGHNVKSRAHQNRIEYCYVHGSCNREFDLVDAQDTEAPESHSLLLGNVIVKDPANRGNRTVIHFGQDGGKQHDGTLVLVNNTIVTPFISPVVDLSASKAKALPIGNIVTDGGSRQNNQVLAAAGRSGAQIASVRAMNNWLSDGFRAKLAGIALDATTTVFGERGAVPPFVDLKRGDFRLASPAKGIADAGLPADQLAKLIPLKLAEPLLAWEYKHPAGGEKRPNDGKPDLGAYEYRTKQNMEDPK